MPVQISPIQVARVVALVEDGRSQRYAARIVGLPETTVRRAIQRYRETGQYSRRPGSGSSRIMQNIDDRFIGLQISRNPYQTAVITNRNLRNARGTVVSDRTICRRFRSLGFIARRPAIGMRLLRRHRVARLDFARIHLVWNELQWSQVLFTDESRFMLRSVDGRRRVWRRRGERYEDGMFSERESFGGGSLMVWGGITSDARTELFVFPPRQSLNAVRYIEILNEHVVPFAPYIGEEFLLMQDNARPHTAVMITQFLNDVGINRMPWPAKSPDMNPIEHLWDELGQRVSRRNPENLNELRIALTEEWDNIPQITITNLIESMPRRMEAVIAARGGNTRY